MTPDLRLELTDYVSSESELTDRMLRASGDMKLRSDELLGRKAESDINRLLGRNQRRALGVFFSGPAWAARLLEGLDVGSVRRIIDPACGIGDLLVECARRLPLGKSYQDTIDSWARRFVAHDLMDEFTSVAWLRMQTLAHLRHSAGDVLCATGVQKKPSSFVGINTLDGSWKLCPDDLVVMNPPFHKMPVPSWSKLAEGNCTAAMLFVERVVKDSPAGVNVAAILPEVLRSGSRYKAFRRFLSETCEVAQFSAEGSFGGDADVDVAILRLRTSGRTAVVHPRRASDEVHADRLGSICRVRVGTVVPHRERQDGGLHPYLDVSNTPLWSEIIPTFEASYRGTLFQPPFVVVRRTSSPKDKQRARATMIFGSEGVLIENHLLVLLPADKSEETCRKIMRILAAPSTTNWLNSHIRCRHLTVAAVAQIPIGVL